MSLSFSPIPWGDRSAASMRFVKGAFQAVFLKPANGRKLSSSSAKKGLAEEESPAVSSSSCSEDTNCSDRSHIHYSGKGKAAALDHAAWATERGGGSAKWVEKGWCKRGKGEDGCGGRACKGSLGKHQGYAVKRGG
eukprot:388832-Pleurochrysis_carterae.AAC.1